MAKRTNSDALYGRQNEVEVGIGQGRAVIRVDAPAQTRLQIDLEATPASGAPVLRHRLVYGPPIARRVSLWQRLQALRVRPAFRLNEAVLLISLAFLVYLATRLIALQSYPIYFFTDEAVQTTLAADLVRDHFRAGGELLPAFFRNAYQYNLGTSVYLQVLPYLLFGKSILVTRGTSVLISLIAAVSLGLSMRNIFQSPYPWAAVLFLSITPAWFLHSRTAFETSVATSFYAGFFYTYLLYRTKNPRALYAAVVFGALVFYSYSPARMVILVTAVLLFLSDIRYHWQQREIVLRALGLVFLAALPFLRFQIIHPQENLRHLEVLNSYWIQNIPLKEKLGTYFSQYALGLDPFYWFLELNGDMARHVMTGYGHLLRASLPFAVIGLLVAIRRIRQAPYRAVLLSLLAAPAGGALVEIGITRVLIMVIPAAVISGLGLAAVLEWVRKRWRFSKNMVALPVFALMAGFNFWMVRDAVVNGPFWRTDYGLGGMQWGASEIFGKIQEMAEENPSQLISLSPSWANGTDTIAQFFFEDALPFRMESIDGYFDRKVPLDHNRVFIMIPEEYERVIQSPKFRNIKVDQILEYPNGQPGFYFVRLEYSAEIDAILAKESAERRILQEEEVVIQGASARVRYSSLDMGPIKNLFDGDLRTLVRTFEANPLKVEITFEQLRTITGLRARIGGTATRLTYRLLDEDGRLIAAGETSAAEAPDPRWLDIGIEAAPGCKRVLLEVRSIHDLEPAHVHLWEIELQ